MRIEGRFSAQERGFLLHDGAVYLRESWRQNLLRVHHEQPAEGAVHWCDEQDSTASVSTQNTYVRWFTAKYNVTILVYFERYGSVLRAIAREKELKTWRREKKVELIERLNPKWRDLSYGWYQPTQYRTKTSAIIPVLTRCHPERTRLRGREGSDEAFGPAAA